MNGNRFPVVVSRRQKAKQQPGICLRSRVNLSLIEKISMPDFLYGARLQGFTVVVFIVAKSRAWFDEYIYHDSLQARAIEGIGH